MFPKPAAKSEDDDDDDDEDDDEDEDEEENAPKKAKKLKQSPLAGILCGIIPTQLKKYKQTALDLINDKLHPSNDNVLNMA